MSGGFSAGEITGMYAVLVAIIIILVWIVFCGFISWIDGWRKLIWRFRCHNRFEGEIWHFVSAWMRWGTHFGAALTVGANQEGLYLQMLWLLRAGHPTLFIPWSEVTLTGSLQGIIPKTCFQLGREERVPLWMTRKMGDRILALRPAQASPAEPTQGTLF